jgi:hypothetical protein
MNILKGEPVKAFIYQDHEAHIQAHMAAAQNPKMQAMMEKNPNGPAVMAAASAHLMEHVGFLFRQQIEQELGAPLPGPEEPMPEDIELRISRLAAPAAAQLTGKAEREAQAEEQAKQQEDPIIQMQQKELALKEQAQADKKEEAIAKVQANIQIATERIALEREKLQQTGMIKAEELRQAISEMEQDGMLEAASLLVRFQGDQMKAGAQADQLQANRQTQTEKRQSDESIAGYKMGLDLARDILEGIRKANASE